MCWCWMPKSSCSVRSMYLQELNFILLFTGGGEHNVDFIVQRPYFSRLAEGGPHSGTPVDAMGPLVTTASLGYKEQDRHVFQRLKELDALGLAAEYFDFDDSPARSFADYNAASFLGGNPFYLLKSWRACGAESILEEFLKDEKRLIGCSAGRFVMQCSIAFIARCTPEMINPPACWTPPGFV